MLLSDPVHALSGLVKSLMGGLSSAAPMFGMLMDTVGSLAKGAGQSILSNLLNTIGGNFGAGTPASSAPSSQAANVAIVKSWASPYGWQSGAEWDALVSVINRESGFRNTAQNPTSTAYGMFQFLDSTWASLGFSKTSDPVRQAMAGMKYISGRYGDPLAALRHEQAFGWYDQGGLLPPGPSLVYNGTGAPELIAPKQTFEQIINGSSGGSGPTHFTGDLYLDSGEWLGKVRGIAQEEAADTLMMAANRGSSNR
jgi:SLT domain-containing protein